MVAGNVALWRFVPMSEYYGWKNYETWNILLWLWNDENLDDAVTGQLASIMEEGKPPAKIDWYEAFRIVFNAFDEFGMKQTPDGVDLNDPNICWEEIAGSLNDCMEEKGVDENGDDFDPDLDRYHSGTGESIGDESYDRYLNRPW
jgi:hypothetical protein